MIGRVGNLSVDPVLIPVAVASVYLMRMATALLTPLFVAIIVLRFITIAVWVKVVRIWLARGHLMTGDLMRDRSHCQAHCKNYWYFDVDRHVVLDRDLLV